LRISLGSHEQKVIHRISRRNVPELELELVLYQREGEVHYFRGLGQEHYTTLDTLRRSHPAWRLLRFAACAVGGEFSASGIRAPNVRVMAQADLVEKLEDVLFGLRLSD
jgi:hypothetical protein